MYGFQQQKNNLVKGLVNLTQGKNKQATEDLSNCPKLLDLGDKKVTVAIVNINMYKEFKEIVL